MTKPNPETSRTRRDPRQKAQGALDVATRKVARIDAQITAREKELASLRDERVPLEKDRAFLATHYLLNDDTPQEQTVVQAAIGITPSITDSSAQKGSPA